MEEPRQHTCITCGVAFQNADLQRDHYKSDWHRYNLKRKVAEFEPVTLENFQQRMIKHEQEMKKLSGEIKAPTGYCAPCRKNFSTEKAYENHLNSKKHREVATKFSQKKDAEVIANNRLNRKPSETMDEDAEESEDEDLEVEEVDSDEWEEEEEPREGSRVIGVEECIFCSHASKDMEKNLIHLTEKHSFFLPDPDYLVDLEGMMTHLGEKVGLGFMCLYCNLRSKNFLSIDAVQKHMVDKQHCKILNEGKSLAEFSRFYDYSTSYPEAKAQNERMEHDGDNERDEEVQIETIDDSGYELTLPSGAKIGHRSLMRYYKQSLNPERAVTVHRRGVNHRVLNHYKALGWSGLPKAEARKKAKDIKFMRHAQQKHYMKLGVKANKLQKHWVDPTL